MGASFVDEEKQDLINNILNRYILTIYIYNWNLKMTELDEFDSTLNSELDKLQREIDGLSKKDYN